MANLLRKMAQPRIPIEIRQDLERVVDILVRSGAPILEIRLFGSLHKDRWSEDISDIDLFVLLENDPRYSCFFSDQNRIEVRNGESQERRAVYGLLERNSEIEFIGRYELYLLTGRDLEELYAEGSAELADNMKSGSLLYKRENEKK